MKKQTIVISKSKSKASNLLRVVGYIAVILFSISSAPLKADQEQYTHWHQSGNGNEYDLYVVQHFDDNGRLLWVRYDLWKNGNTVFSKFIPGGINPNPDDGSGDSKGADPTNPASGIVWAIEHGQITVIAKESPLNSELFDFGGIGDGPATPFWNPYDEGSGRVSPSDTIGGEDTEKRLHLIESLKGGIPGSSGSSFTDAEGEFTGLPSSPSGGAGTGTGSGDNTGDGHTDSEGNENGYFHNWAGTDGLTIHPQADPTP